MNPRVCPACRKPLTAAGPCPHCGHNDKTLTPTVAAVVAIQTKTRNTGEPANLPARLGHYRILRELGRGGMGRILEAVDESLGRHVAVKVQLSPLSEKDTRRRRFIEEARITGCLEHPGIAPVYTLGRAPDGSEFFSMKLVVGRDLDAILNDRQRGDPAVLREYTLARLLSIFERIVETIAYAHAQGILHRDLKPANIMAGAHGEVWVLDWGLAKAQGQGEAAGSDQQLTNPGSPVGTAQYMAPEQARGREADVRSDLFGLGGILYKVLTGQPPNQGANAMGTLMNAAIGGQFTPVRGTPGGRRASPELAAIAEKCLAARPEDRYASALDLLADLRAHAAGEAIRARPDSPLGKVIRLARRHRRAAAVCASAAILLLLGWTLVTTLIAAKDRRALAAERNARAMEEKAQAAELARQIAIARSAARAQQRVRAFAPYAEATDLLMRGQSFDQAAKLLEEALRIDAEFPEAQFALGEAFRLGGVPGSAAPAYLRANQLSRQISGRPHLQALLAAGIAFDGAGDYYNSEQAFLQADREGAGHPLALVGKALRLAHERRLKEARTAAEEALRKAPHLWETYFACGYVLEELVNMGFEPPEPSRSQALTRLRKSLELSPRQAEACVWLARTLNATGTPENRAEALRWFNHAIDLEPRNGNRYITRGLAGDAQSAAADLQKARDLGASRGLLLYADANLAARRGDHPTAFRLVGELIQETRDWPPTVGSWLALGFQLRRDQEIRGRFQKWCRDNPEYPEVYALKAQVKARDADFAAAVAEDKAGLKVAPWNRKLLGQLTFHLQKLGNWPAALAAADDLLKIAPNDFATQAHRARCLSELGRGAEAKSLLDRLQKEFPARAKEIEDLRRSLAGRLPK